MRTTPDRRRIAAAEEHDEPLVRRELPRGRAYVYVVACRSDTLLKIGYSRDPLQRLRAFRPRFFDFFELDRSLLVELPRVALARQLERDLHRAFAEHSAPAPIIVNPGAAGHTEWFRGIFDEAVAMAKARASAGGWHHASLMDWMAGVLGERQAALFNWAASLDEQREYAENNLDGRGSAALTRALADGIDAFLAVGLDPYRSLPTRVAMWHRGRTPSMLHGDEGALRT